MNATATLIDSHCHLDFDYSPKNGDLLVQEALAGGLSHLITVGTEVKTFPSHQAFSEHHACVFHTIGIHPHEAVTVTAPDLDTIKKFAAHPKCRAIGEIGLDYFYDHSPRDVQISRLRDQLEIALEMKLPVVIHARDAEADLVEAFEVYSKRVPGGQIPGVIHCFTGTEPFARKCLDLGFYISFSGILTFPKSLDLKSTAQKLPLDRLLVETDSPFLAPVPLRGKKCEPSMVIHTARMLAQLQGKTFEEVAQATSANTRRVFKIS